MKTEISMNAVKVEDTVKYGAGPFFLVLDNEGNPCFRDGTVVVLFYCSESSSFKFLDLGDGIAFEIENNYTNQEFVDENDTFDLDTLETGIGLKLQYIKKITLE